jgi:oligoendopeptidase F
MLLCWPAVAVLASAVVVQDCLLDFLMLMSDPDRHVRKAAVVALSAVVHHKPGLVAAGLEQLLPQLFDQTAVKPEMVGV